MISVFTYDPSWGDVPHALEKDGYCVAVGWNVLYIAVGPIWSVVLVKFPVSLLMLCLDDLSIVGCRVLKSSAIVTL